MSHAWFWGQEWGSSGSNGSGGGSSCGNASMCHTPDANIWAPGCMWYCVTWLCIQLNVTGRALPVVRDMYCQLCVACTARGGLCSVGF
jgi:hypothetical protein